MKLTFVAKDPGSEPSGSPTLYRTDRQSGCRATRAATTAASTCVGFPPWTSGRSQWGWEREHRGVTVAWQESASAPRPGKAAVPAAEVTSSPGFSTRVDRLRRRLIELGLAVDEIATALVAELHLRPRAAYRYAVGMSGQAAADVYNAKFGTAQVDVAWVRGWVTSR